MAIANSNNDSASPWNMPLWIITSAKLCPPVVHSPGLHGLLDKLFGLVGYFIHFSTVLYPALGDHVVRFFVVDPGHS